MTNKNLEKQWLLKEKYHGIESADFVADLKKLEAGEPLAFVIGNIPFLHCVIDLEFRPLIPRPETEFWTNLVLQNEISDHSNFCVLDIFSGSGCIGIGLLKNTQEISVDFGELQKQNIQQIEKNLNLNEIAKNRFRVFESDVFQSIPKKKYNLILANPPYISRERQETVETSVLDYEDSEALFADNDGLYFVEKLIQESRHFLKPNGKVFVEFDPWQKELIEKILKDNSITKYSFIFDQYKKPRVLQFEY